MGNIRASSWLDYDASNESSDLSKQASTLASAKKSGGGWGALIGGILGQILIPIPGVGAAIGAGLGGAAGSVAGGAMSGTSQDDIRGGKFYKNSRNDILDTIAGNQLDQSLMSAAKYGMMGLNPSSGLVKGTKGFTEGFTGGGGLMGGLKGSYQALAGKAPTAAVLGDTPNAGGWGTTGTGGMTNQMSRQHMAGEAMDYNINDIVKTIDESGVNTLGRTAETVGGNIPGGEIVETLDTNSLAQNLVSRNLQDEDEDESSGYRMPWEYTGVGGR